MATQVQDPKTAEHAGKIDAKQAVRKAVAYFLHLYPQLKDANVMLEEVEESEDGAYWLITMGYDVKRARSAPIAGLPDILGPQLERRYKVVKIEAKTGKIVSMKIRTLK